MAAAAAPAATTQSRVRSCAPAITSSPIDVAGTYPRGHNDIGHRSCCAEQRLSLSWPNAAISLGCLSTGSSAVHTDRAVTRLPEIAPGNSWLVRVLVKISMAHVPGTGSKTWHDSPFLHAGVVDTAAHAPCAAASDTGLPHQLPCQTDLLDPHPAMVALLAACSCWMRHWLTPLRLLDCTRLISGAPTIDRNR